MPGKNKKSESNDFLIQGAILAIAGILVRFIGLAYRVPLDFGKIYRTCIQSTAS